MSHCQNFLSAVHSLVCKLFEMDLSDLCARDYHARHALQEEEEEEEEEEE